MKTTTIALKEWNVAVNALENGNTIMLLRKGGIREQGSNFTIPHIQALLYPTFEHQQPDLLKPKYASQVPIVDSGWHPEKIKISSFAKITNVLPVSDKSIRTYAGTLYIAYCQNEIVNTIISYFRIDIKSNIYKNKFAKC